MSEFQSGRIVARPRSLEQLAYLDEHDDVDDDDDDARDVVAEHRERDDEARVLRRHEVTVVLPGAVDAVVDDRVHGNGEHQQPATSHTLAC